MLYSFFSFAVCQNDLRGLDLVFVIDSSGSIGSTNFQLMRDFVKNVVMQFVIGPDRTQVGMITFNNTATVQFQLSAHNTKTSLLQAINNIPYPGDGSNLPAALNTLIAQFNTAFGARPRMNGIPRIAVVVTDGESGNLQATIAAANQVHANNILTYVVGVGDDIDINELRAIATDSQHISRLSAFNEVELKEIREFLNKEACSGSES